MSSNFKNQLKTYPKKQAGFACSPIVLKKIEQIAHSIGWGRNALIVASIMHVIRMIDDKTYHLIPDVVIQTRALKKLHRINFSTEETTAKKNKLIQSTAFACNPIILKKIDQIVHAIGWSRNAFILASILHLISLVEDEESAFVPTVVILARAVIYGDKIPLTFSSNSSDEDQKRLSGS